jgi:hypothetical protein
LVIDMTAFEPPAAARAPVLHGTVVTNLRQVGAVDPRVVLIGPLQSVEVVHLAPAERVELVADTVEHTVFVTEGGGAAEPFGEGAGGARVPLVPGTALTVPLGTGAELTAGPDGLEYVHAVLTAAAPAGPGQQKEASEP